MKPKYMHFFPFWIDTYDEEIKEGEFYHKKSGRLMRAYKFMIVEEDHKDGTKFVRLLKSVQHECTRYDGYFGITICVCNKKRFNEELIFKSIVVMSIYKFASSIKSKKKRTEFMNYYEIEGQEFFKISGPFYEYDD
jgi:hypothetical protein